MKYEAFVEAFNALSRIMGGRFNTVVYIPCEMRVLNKYLKFRDEDSILYRHEVEAISLDNMTSKEISDLVFEPTADPKIVILCGQEDVDPVNNIETLYAGLKMVRLSVPDPTAMVVIYDVSSNKIERTIDAIPFYCLDEAMKCADEMNNPEGWFFPFSERVRSVIARVLIDESEFKSCEDFF